MIKGKKFTIRPASPDAAIYKRGVVFGITTLKKVSKVAPKSKPGPDESK